MCISYTVSFDDMFRLQLRAIFRLISFFSKVKYTISNDTVIVTYIINFHNLNFNTTTQWNQFLYVKRDLTGNNNNSTANGIFYLTKKSNRRSQRPRGLRPLACCDCGFESHRGMDVCLL